MKSVAKTRFMSCDGLIRFDMLPGDIQEMLECFLERFGVENPNLLDWHTPRNLAPDVPLMLVQTADMFAQLKDEYWKENGSRGMQYIREMMGCELPPVVVKDGKLIDGWHRTKAAKKAGLAEMLAIDFSRWLAQCKKGLQPIDAPVMA